MKKFLLAHWATILTILVIGLASGLRLYRLDSVPPGLYWEEVALGYDAYSLSQTGADHHGNHWPIAAFKSFGDWKPSLYFYAIVPFIYLFNLSAWAVRLPSALAGILICWRIGKLAQLFLSDSAESHLSPAKKILVILLQLMAAVNPALLQFSRAAFEANLATWLILEGVIAGYQYLLANQSKKIWQALIFLILAAYTYHSARIVAPTLGVFLVIADWQPFSANFRRQLAKKWKLDLALGLTALVLLAPIWTQFNQPEISHRWQETSLISDLEIIKTSNSLKAAAGNSWWSRLIFHRYLLFGQKIFLNWLSHWQLDYLFISGDGNWRHSTQAFGVGYYFEIIPWLAGLMALWQSRRRLSSRLLFFWLTISLLPASLTTAVPHTLRTLIGLPAWLMIAWLGWQLIFKLVANQGRLFKKLPVSSGLVMGLYLVFALWWTVNYFTVYPWQSGQDWQVGYQPVIQALNNLAAQNPQRQIYFTRAVGRPAMYYWFYSQTNPQLVQQAAPTATYDQGEFLTYDQITFFNQLPQPSQPSLLVTNELIPANLASQSQLAFTWTSPQFSHPLNWYIYLVN